ncbi:MAG: TetR/AcrR family transcriptional regulator [Alphaproteobacteria bacterium]|nr:TetR/AcrR family transcriptional regulator [Alphaproteobacteria bacterium]
MSKQTTKNVREKTVAAAMSLAAAEGWETVTLHAIAAQAKLSLAVLREHFDDKTDILAAYGRGVDRRVLEQTASAGDDTSPPRDRLFDVLMERFEILNEDRNAVCAILRSFRCDPKQAVIGLPHLGRSMVWMLEAAQIETGGIKGALRVAGLTGLYLKTLWVWARDDSADLAATMAALDKNLSRAERWAARIVP